MDLDIYEQNAGRERVRMVECDACKGFGGRIVGDDEIVCTDCDGHGEVEQVYYAPVKRARFSRPIKPVLARKVGA